MADRKQTPNILNDLLGGGAPPPAPTDTSIPVSQQAGKTARQHTGKTARQPTRKPEGQPAGTEPEQPASEEPKLKATYYLSPGSLEALDEAWLKLRKMARARAQVSKSLIVERAILLAVEELKAKGDKSHIASKLVSQQDSKPS